MNKDTEKATRLLEGAYAIRDPADNIDYYREFAELYDHEYADRMGYIYPSMLASVYKQYAGSNDSPIADVGCGTGLVAQAFKDIETLTDREIDGIDISQEMLDAAKPKHLYRSLYCADLTESADQLPNSYGSVVSAGTFTFGHLGPELLRDILYLGRQGTLYCIGVNSVYFQEQGFPNVLNSLCSEGLIGEPVAEVRNIYDQSTDDSSDNAHRNDTATVLVYRQLKQ